MCSKVNCKNKICRCVKACQNHGVLDPLTCTCACPDYAAGAECENLICSKTFESFQEAQTIVFTKH